MNSPLAKPRTGNFTRSARLQLEHLETRLLLDADPVTWGSDVRLTLSFAPDGTQVGDSTSVLFSQMNDLDGPREWQDAILRGFQTWAQHTNSDIGLVPDSGEPFGSAGMMRRDRRFGDIRVGAVPLDATLFAVAIPGDAVVDGTWVGDVLFNSDVQFADVDEVFAVALHEAGHVFGLPHSSDSTSPMFTHGIPALDARTPTADDLALLQSSYGPRPLDVYDADPEPGPVEVPAFRVPNGVAGSAPSLVFADISSPDDVDTYRVEIPSSYHDPDASLSVTLLVTGVSGLSARMDVLDDRGGFIAAGTSSGQSDASIQLQRVSPGDKFQIDVESLPGDFSVGGYTLIVTYDLVNDMPSDMIDSVARYPIRQLHLEDLRAGLAHGLPLLIQTDGGSNDLPGDEQELLATPGFPGNANYRIDASIEAAGDVDRYRIESPNTLPVERNGARLNLQSLDGASFTGDIAVYDSNHVLIASEILVRNDDSTVLQFGSVQLEAEYFVEISAAPESPTPTGSYRFEASFGRQLVERSLLAGDVLDRFHPTQQFRLTATRPQLFHFELDASDNDRLAASLRMTIRDERGTAIGMLTTAVGDARTMAIYLPAGVYRVVVRAHTAAGFPSPIAFQLRGASIDNPLGPRVDDPTTEPFTFEIDRRVVFLALFLGV